MDAAPPPQSPALVRPTTAPSPSRVSGRIQMDTLTTPFLKDPSFVADGAPVGGTRYIAFGDLRHFYLKAFAIEGRRLQFKAGEIPLAIQGLPAQLDSPWAPQLVVAGDRIDMYYCAGEMPPPHPPRWPTFRLRKASMPLADFVRQAGSGKAVTFKDEGPILSDLEPFGQGDQDFGVIDPHLYVNPQGRAFMTYTIVRAGTGGKRLHEEFVRYREVDPRDSTRALTEDRPLYDGRARTPDDGVAEAQDVVTLDGRTYAFISSRAGDHDQRLLIAPVRPDLGPIAPGQARPFLEPGGQPWYAKALGSSSVAVLDGTPYIVFQGLDVDRRFSLGWMRLEQRPTRPLKR